MEARDKQLLYENYIVMAGSGTTFLPKTSAQLIVFLASGVTGSLLAKLDNYEFLVSRSHVLWYNSL